MMDNPTPTNRISAILDETEAIQSVQRSDGAFGSAAVTPERGSHSGKKSAATDHLASIVSLPSESREDEQLLRQFRDELTLEFNPRTFSQTAAIDLLAHDYLQLSRLRAAIEPPTPRPYIRKDEMENQRILEDNVRCIHCALEFVCGFGRPCAHEQALRVTDLVVGWIKNLEDYVTPTEDSLPEQAIPAVKKRHRKIMAEIEEFEKLLLQERQAEWESLRPYIKKLIDRDHLYYFFSGLLSVGPRERDQLQGLLHRLQENQEMVLDVRARLAPRIDGVRVEERSTEELIVLQRRICDLEKTIERKLKILRQDK
jgi:hypothetical protein